MAISGLIPLPVQEAARRIAVDHELLEAAVTSVTIESLGRPYQVGGGPVGDFCESLHDLVAHVLMWDEINLAVLTEARAGRAHWSLESRWETPDAGRTLNRAGVTAGRWISSDLLLHRLACTRTALLDELTAMTDERWATPPGIEHPAATTMAGVIEHVMTVPNNEPYWHAAIHLGQLAVVTGEDAEGPS